MTKANRQNVPRHQIIHWVRRKAGSQLIVLRRRQDGSLGCSVPCHKCKAVLDLFDLRVGCVVDNGGQAEWYSGRLTDPGAPEPKLTRGQLKQLSRKAWQAGKDIS